MGFAQASRRARALASPIAGADWNSGQTLLALQVAQKRKRDRGAAE